MSARTVDEETIRRWIAENGGSSPGSSYLVWTALLNQSDTNAPVATVLENTLTEDVLIQYIQVGEYQITCPEFTLGKTWVVITSRSSRFMKADVLNGSVEVQTRSSTSVLTDGFLVNTPIEIRVYP